MSDAVRLLWEMLPGSSGFHCFRLGNWEGGQIHLWHPVARRDRFDGIVKAHGWTSDLQIAARPYTDRGSFRLNANSGCVWARTETGRQAAALAAFPLEPTLVLREGSTVRLTAFWALRRDLDPDDGERVGKHLAHRLRTAKKWAAQLWFTPPGAVIRAGKRPVPVVVAGGSGELHSMRQLARHLPRKIPDPMAWRGAAAK